MAAAAHPADTNILLRVSQRQDPNYPCHTKHPSYSAHGGLAHMEAFAGQRSQRSLVARFENMAGSSRLRNGLVQVELSLSVDFTCPLVADKL
jgi:hypothetical protein